MTYRTLLISILLLSSRFTVAQQPGELSYRDDSTFPAGMKGKRIRAIIEAINVNDAARVRSFIENECTEKFRTFAPMSQHLEIFLRTARETGGVDFHSVRSYVPARAGETIVIIKDRNYESWRAFVVRFGASPDSLVSGLEFSAARTPANVKEAKLSESEFIQTIDDLITRLCAGDVFSGAVLVAYKDDALLVRACGEASKGFHVANTIETKFNLGSMNKMFTATAIVQLAEKGVLCYEDRISTYVDESWLPRTITDRVTVHHLLTHTSGLGSYFNEAFWNGSRLLYRDLDDFKPLVHGETLAFEPGERFQYSNTGMLILGAVIESVTKGSYFDYIREHIYKPAGMKNSDSYEMDFPVENLAIGYIPEPGSEFGWRNNLYQHVIKGGPAGGGFSTVIDLHHFARALLQGTLVSRASLDKMWVDYSGSGYGYGFTVENGARGKVVGHSGGFPGLNGNLDIFVDKGYIVAVLSNYDGAATPLARKIKQLVERL